MLRMLLSLYSLIVIIHVVVCWLRVPANKWTEMLRSIVEPALQVTRNLMKRFLPFLNNVSIDLSPLVLVIALHLLRAVLTWIV